VEKVVALLFLLLSPFCPGGGIKGSQLFLIRDGRI
jgi:hypothetical protein